MSDYLGTATYSLEDDKLRFYPFHRLDDKAYSQIKELGFVWAPKQSLFVQVWSPSREDLLLTWCGDIEDEGMSLEERATLRSDRFTAYAGNASQRAWNAKDKADQLTSAIPMGQPVLVGHHSERRARKDIERIGTGIQRFVDEMKRAEYWKSRAAASLRHAAVRERPDVILRRIKTLESDLRKYRRDLLMSAETMQWLRYEFIQELTGKYPPPSYRELSEEEQARIKERLEDAVTRNRLRCERWIEHLENRLVYERQLYETSGGVPAEQKPLEVGGAIRVFRTWYVIQKINRRGGQVTSVNISCPWLNRVTLDKIEEVKTKEEWESTQPGPG